MTGNPLAAASRYAAGGLSVIPCDASTKRPLVKWERFQADRAADTQVREWWERWPDAGIGIVTGSISGLVVVDIDTDAPAAPDAVAHRFGATPRAARTPRGGQHHYYRHPGKIVPNAVRLAGFDFPVDLRGDGGYVIAPPSAGYSWERTAPRDALPVFPLDAIASRQRREHRAQTPAEGWRGLLNGVQQGKRNASLAQLVGVMFAKGTDRDVARSVARDFATRCQPPLDPDEAEAVFASIYTRDSRERGQALVVNLTDVVPERVSWLWPGRIPLGKVTLLEGDPGLGKSVLTCDLAARLTHGDPMPDGFAPAAGGVVILSAEDGLADTIRPRLEAAGADLSRVVSVPVVRSAKGERLPELPTDLEELERVIRAAGARLVIIDPLMAFLGSEVNSWRDQDVRRALAPLARVAEETGAAVVVVRHLNKGTGTPAIYRGGGSIGIAGAARSVLLVAKDPEDEQRRVLAPVKSNLGAPAPALAFRLEGDAATGAVSVVWLGATERTADELLAMPASVEERTAVEEGGRFLTGVLADGPIPANEVQRQARAAGFSEPTLRRVKKALGVRAHRRGFNPGVWVWSLPGVRRCTVDGEDAQAQSVSIYDAFGAPSDGGIDGGSAS